MRRAAMVALTALVVLAAPAAAHQASVTYSTATVDGAAVDYQIRIAGADLAEPTGRDPTAPIRVVNAPFAGVSRPVTAAVTAVVPLTCAAPSKTISRRNG